MREIARAGLVVSLQHTSESYPPTPHDVPLQSVSIRSSRDLRCALPSAKKHSKLGPLTSDLSLSLSSEWYAMPSSVRGRYWRQIAYGQRVHTLSTQSDMLLPSPFCFLSDAS